MTASVSTMIPDRHNLQMRIIRKNVIQVLIVLVVAVALFGLGYTLRESLAARGIAFSFNYMNTSAGFELSEGMTLQLSDPFGLVLFSSEMTNAQALLTGLFNTIKAAVLAIVLATVLGVFLGTGRLSTNWLIRQICFWIVEFLRNTPLLIQLTFWYVAVVLKLPPLAGALHFGGIIFAQQGIWFPSLAATEGATTLSVITLLLAVVAAGFAISSKSKTRRIVYIAVAAALAGWACSSGFPLTLDLPSTGKFRASGGLQLTPEFSAILIAISVNSAAYIGEVVRGAIESLPKGQWEAAASLGFSRKHSLRDIILPQVLRVVLPSFGNQYISLAKNTSLGIAIGFPDLFNVYGTIANQTGRSMEGVIIVMIVYLLMSWVISGLVNLANIKLRIPGAR